MTAHDPVLGIFQRRCVVDGTIWAHRSTPEVALAARRRLTQQPGDTLGKDLATAYKGKTRQRVEAVIARGSKACLTNERRDVRARGNRRAD